MIIISEFKKMKSNPETANTIFVTINGNRTTYPLSIRRLLEAAREYKDRAWTPGDTLVIDDRRIHPSDIIELNMPGRLALARLIVDDLYDDEVAA